MGRKRGRPRKGMDSDGRGEASSSRLPETIILEDEVWVLRPAKIMTFDPYQEYGREGLFTIVMHHGGVFHNGLYVGGRLNYIDESNTIRFNLFELSSIMVALGYPREYICEWYYCDPVKNLECVGMKYGEPRHPLYDEKRMDRFLSFLGGKWKEIHVYSVEITYVEAVVKLKEDELQIFDKFLRRPNSGVVIEEIEEAPKPKSKPKRRPKRKAEPLMLCWYEPDPEFEEFLRNSLEEDKKRRQRFEQDGLSGENLTGRLNEVGGVPEDGGVAVEGALEAKEPVHVEESGHAGVFEEVINSGGVPEDGGVAVEGAIEAEEPVHAEESVHAFVMGQPVVLEEVGIEIPIVDEMPNAEAVRRERGKAPIDESMGDAEYMAFFDDM